MPIATDTAEFLEELNGGAFASQIGHALSEVAAGVVDHGKVGKLVITLDFSQIGESSQVKIKHKLDYKVPTKRGTRSENTSLDTPMHVGSGGKISLFAEKHDQIFTRDAKFDGVVAARFSPDILFVIGRNIYQAACGSANAADSFIEEFSNRTKGLNHSQPG